MLYISLQCFIITRIRVLLSFRIIAIASYQSTTPSAGVDVDLAYFQPTTDQPISISTYTADECFGAIGELPKYISTDDIDN
ncbi:hypothetical protein V1477_005810 [Vespula maculifrons]|uniref:Uncharacterized protein n=1 Tax=Vespula maculifrons TaxID=7453 RepID=A0ABD2CLA6_VESMC